MGDEVVLMQMRLKDLGYFSYKVTGVYGSFTSKAVEAFQRANGLNPDGHMGETTASYLYSPTAKRGVGILRATPTPTPKATPRPTKPTYGKLIDWKDASGKVARWNGPKFQIRDFYTGVTYYVYRVGGSNHMDIAPASKDDTAKLKRTYGGRWTWSRRPVLVRLGGTWYAASINGMPHNEAASVKGNGMDGQICLHFLNSKTHIHNAKDPEHQRCVQIAAGKKK